MNVRKEIGESTSQSSWKVFFRDMWFWKISREIWYSFIFLFRRFKKRLLKGRKQGSGFRIPRWVSVSSFLRSLEESGCRYVVLRWFERLPHVEKGGDIDILVADDDVEKIVNLLTRSIILGGRVKCDVYSESGGGLFGYGRRRMPYYPPKISAQILDRAVKHKSEAFIPSLEDHLLSLIYHALYHKGYKSGLPINSSGTAVCFEPDHDYSGVLRDLSNKLGINIDINMTDLDSLMAKKGWRPTLDSIDYLARKNEWCQFLVERDLEVIEAPEGFSLFVIRKVAGAEESVAWIRRQIERYKFNILAEKRLSTLERAKAVELIRGGNWGLGSHPFCGGTPVYTFLIIDPTPKAADHILSKHYPRVDNGRVFDFKYELRELWNQQQDPAKHTNIIHTSDNAKHAMHYVSEVLPQFVDEVKNYAN